MTSRGVCRQRRRRRTYIGLIALCVWTIPAHLHAADPPSGSISLEKPTVGWSGPPAEASVVQNECTDPGATCDEFNLVVDVPVDYWEQQEGGAEVGIQWDDPDDNFSVQVFDDDTGESVGFADTLPGERTSVTAFVADARGSYTVLVRYVLVTSADYRGRATLVSGVGDQGVVFDELTTPAFAPATIVSAHFLGTEPMMVMERPISESPPGVIDPNRIFVDWILGSSTGISQLSRSLDGGDTFRLLIDLECALRSRPTCQEGGGDSDSEVNPFTGTVYFADLFIQNVTIASSTDHGNTFPPSREAQASVVSDRQWIGASDPDVVSVDGRKIEAFLSYQTSTGPEQFIHGIDEDGRLVPQPVPQLENVFGDFGGPIRIDSTGGAGHGWIYKPLERNIDLGGGGFLAVATAPASDYQLPTAWQANRITKERVNIRDFPWLDLDDSGNAFVLWTTKSDSRVHYSFSSITDPANDPSKGGRPGTKWSTPMGLSLPSLGSTVFPEVTAGSRGRIAITYMGTEDFRGQPDDAPPGTRWDTFAAIVTNALREEGPAVVKTGKVNHRVAHLGAICTEGIGCENDRSLADMIDIGHDADGRIGVVFTDNHGTFAEDVSGPDKLQPFSHFAKQTAGPSLLVDKPDIDVSIAEDERADPSGDSTWPNTTAGMYLSALDVLGVSLELDEGEVVARLPLADASTEAMTANLGAYNASFPSQPNGQRLQYAVRFSTADEIYHLSMEHLPGGSRRFFGGMLDENDRLAAGDSPETEGLFKGAGYHTDEKFAVTGVVEGNTIVLRAKLSDFGLHPGTELFSVTGFAMAGPVEEEETTIMNTMRTVDATPPLDTALVPPKCNITGTSGKDLLTGTIGDDVICGLGGDDTILAREGNDEVLAGAGDDTVRGGKGHDSVKGGPGEDVLKRSRGNDRLLGNQQGDQVRGGRGNDELVGGSGPDLLVGHIGLDVLIAGKGSDLLRGGPQSDTCTWNSKEDTAINCEVRTR